VIEAQPEIVLLPGEPGPFSAQDADLFRALDIPAAHSGRIILIDGTLLTWHGTRLAYALRDLPVLFLKGAE
jgi:ABC-type hemin transport system substrate-binding protein